MRSRSCASPGRRSSIERTCSRPSGDRRVGAGRGRRRPTARGRPEPTVDAPALTRAKLRQLLGALDELNPLTFREGPHTILERYLERTGPGARPHRRRHARGRSGPSPTSRASCASRPTGRRPTRAGRWRVRRLSRCLPGGRRRAADERRAVRGRRGRPADDAVPGEGPRVPDRLRPEPARRGVAGQARAAAACSRASCCARPCPTGDIHIDEERRLLYVAMTRAQERLILTTHGGPAATKEPSRFVGELLDGAGEEVRVIDRTGRRDRSGRSSRRTNEFALSRRRRRRPMPARAIAAADRRRPPGHAAADRPRATARAAPAGERARRAHGGDGRRRSRGRRRPATGFEAELADVGRSARDRPPTRRAPQGLDPLTFRTLALDAGAGANLLQVAPLPRDVQLLVAPHVRGVPAPVRVRLRLPDAAAPRSRSPRSRSARRRTRRSRRSPRSVASALARGEPPPTREDLEPAVPGALDPDGLRRQGRPRRATSGASTTLLDNFWDGEVSSRSARRSRRSSTSTCARPRRRHAARRHLRRDRPHRPAAVGRHRGHRLQDRQGLQPEGRRREPPALDLRARLPRRAGPRHARAGDAVLHRVGDADDHDAHGRAARRGPRGDPGPRVADPRRRVRANPGRACQWCDYRAMCPERV